MGVKRPTTIKKRVDFPVYGLDFTADDLLVAGGGGGANRSGVKNNLVTYLLLFTLNEFVIHAFRKYRLPLKWI